MSAYPRRQTRQAEPQCPPARAHETISQETAPPRRRSRAQARVLRSDQHEPTPSVTVRRSGRGSAGSASQPAPQMIDRVQQSALQRGQRNEQQIGKRDAGQVDRPARTCPGSSPESGSDHGHQPEGMQASRLATTKKEQHGEQHRKGFLGKAAGRRLAAFCQTPPEASGTKAALNAPSANRLRNRFGSRCATKNASATGPAPRIAAVRMSRMKPKTRLTSVKEADRRDRAKQSHTTIRVAKNRAQGNRSSAIKRALDPSLRDSSAPTRCSGNYSTSDQSKCRNDIRTANEARNPKPGAGDRDRR